jgi:two-component system sensor histidine kinase UhpB
MLIALTLLILLQAALIAGLLVQARRRRVAEQVVRTSESALRSSYARIRDLAGRLINAQETERTRIARDLHDDACQEVARIAVDLSHVRQLQGRVQDVSAQQALLAVQNRAANVAESLRLVSHDLHPTVLQHLGLLPALEAHCAEVERTHNVQVTFSTDAQAEPGSPEVALSLFRITQEALRNASRHGHARRANVSLTREHAHLTLTVADDGEGFDLTRARANGGLGLVSIEERARLLEGEAAVRSTLKKRTTVEVRVPDRPARLSSLPQYASSNYSVGR